MTVLLACERLNLQHIPQQSVDEIITKYELHPEIADIYVEGEFDRDFLYQYLDAHGRRGEISVYHIDAIAVSSQMVADAGLGYGSNKARVLALAQFLERKLGATSRRIICIADADLDRIFGRLQTGCYSAFTDYTCMEMYFLNSGALQRFLTFTCNLDEAAVSEFSSLATNILPVQFCMRAAVEALGLGVPIPDFTAGFTTKRVLTSFTVERYVSEFLRRNDLSGRGEEIRTLIQDLQSRLDRDIRHKSHGHDFIELLFEYSWLKGGVKLHSKDTEVKKFGGRLVAAGTDFRALDREPLFSRLVTA